MFGNKRPLWLLYEHLVWPTTTVLNFVSMVFISYNKIIINLVLRLYASTKGL